jgi:hypothetical protein
MITAASILNFVNTTDAGWLVRAKLVSEFLILSI